MWFVIWKILYSQSMTFEKELSRQSATCFSHTKPYLIIDLRNRLYTTDRLDVSDRVWQHAWKSYENIDLKKSFKNITVEEETTSNRTLFDVQFPYFLYYILELTHTQMYLKCFVCTNSTKGSSRHLLKFHNVFRFGKVYLNCYFLKHVVFDIQSF